MLAALAVGGVALYDAAANDGEWGESLFGGGGEEQAVVAALSPTPETTVQLVPTVEIAITAVAPPASGYATAEEAIGAFLGEFGFQYAGDCENASFETDIGSYCSLLWEDQFDTRVYMAGLTFSEPDTWLLVSRLGGRDDWTVVDVAEFLGPDEPPPWP